MRRFCEHYHFVSLFANKEKQNERVKRNEGERYRETERDTTTHTIIEVKLAHQPPSSVPSLPSFSVPSLLSCLRELCAALLILRGPYWWAPDATRRSCSWCRAKYCPDDVPAALAEALRCAVHEGGAAEDSGRTEVDIFGFIVWSFLSDFTLQIFVIDVFPSSLPPLSLSLSL